MRLSQTLRQRRGARQQQGADGEGDGDIEGEGECEGEGEGKGVEWARDRPRARAREREREWIGHKLAPHNVSRDNRARALAATCVLVRHVAAVGSRTHLVLR